MELIDIGLFIAYIAAAIAAGGAIVLPLLSAVKQPATLVRPALAVLALVALFGISYSVSGSEISISAATAGVTESGTKLISAGLIVFYVALVAALLGVVYSEISKSFK